MSAPKSKSPVVYKPPYWRYRETDTRTEACTSWAWWHVSPSGVISYSVPWTKACRTKAIGEFRSMGDVVTPRYALTRAEGGIVCSPMNQVIETTFGADVGWKQHLVSGGYTYYGEGLPNWMIQAAGAPAHLVKAQVPDSWLTEAATKVLGKLNQSEAQLTTTLMKLRSNASLFAGAAGRLGRLITTQLRGDTRGRIRSVADSWMEARYAWRVLLREMEKYLKAMAEDLDVAARETSRAKVSGPIDDVSSSGNVYTGVGNVACTTRTIVAGSVRCGVLHQHDTVSRADLVGLRWSDIPYSAWDLVPLSYVLNWVFNVDAVLRTLSAVSVKRLAEWTIVETTATTTRTHGTIPPAAPGWIVDRHPNGAEVRVTVERTRWPVIRNAGIVVKAESLSFLQDLRFLDLVALLTQAATRRK